MTKREMARVEKCLGIRLPANFRAVMTERGEQLRNKTYILDGQKVLSYTGRLFLDTDEMSCVNLAERSIDATGGYFPHWERTYVLIGSNKASDYYALSLDNSPSVWMIGNHCGSVPTRTHASFVNYVEWLHHTTPTRVTTSHYAVVPSVAEQAFLAHIIDEPADDLRRLVFADWLEENGQAPRAGYVRARCALDCRPPEFGTFGDAIEQLRDGRYLAPDVNLPPGFSFDADNSDFLISWGGKHDGMEGGLPSLAKVDLEAIDEADSARILSLRLPGLLETTTIRGLKLGNKLPTHAATLFNCPAASAITRLSMECVPSGESVCPVVAALVASPIVRNLTRLDMTNGLLNKATAEVLASGPFDRLRRLEIYDHNASREGHSTLMAAPWFQRLERLSMELSGPLNLPQLHTLFMGVNTTGLFEEFINNSRLPALKRLDIRCGLISGKQAEALTGLRCGELVDLCIRGTTIRMAHLKVILTAPWARRLEALRIDPHGRNLEPLNKVIDKAPCAKSLRIRRVG